MNSLSIVLILQRLQNKVLCMPQLNMIKIIILIIICQDRIVSIWICKALPVVVGWGKSPLGAQVVPPK